MEDEDRRSTVPLWLTSQGVGVCVCVCMCARVCMVPILPLLIQGINSIEMGMEVISNIQQKFYKDFGPVSG